MPTLAELKPVAADRNYSYRKGIDDATLTIARDKSRIGAALYYPVFVDARLSAQLAWGEYAVLHVPPGEHVVEVRYPIETI